MKYILFLYIIVLCIRAVPTQAATAFAETYISKNTVLLKSKSPYVFTHPVTVDGEIVLTVEPGVRIVFDGGSLFFRKSKLAGSDFIVESKNSSNVPLIACDACTIDIDSVLTEGVRQGFVSAWNGALVQMKNLDLDGISDASGIQVFNNSSLRILGSTIMGFGKGVEVFSSSKAVIEDSIFERNIKSIYGFNSDLKVERNDFDATHIALQHFTSDGKTYTIDARNNWWGSKDQPVRKEYESDVSVEDTNMLVGSMQYIPWSVAPHNAKKKAGISNVLFLPGLMGSRLYKKEGFENQLWEPNRNKDVEKLYLNPFGKSVHPGIYTRDIIGTSNIVGGISMIDQNLYSGFTSYMNGFVQSKKMTAWKATPYDWRYAADSILSNGTTVGNNGIVHTSNLVDDVVGLAKSSKTKKVTLITHSNGGFIAKQLMIELKNQNLDTLVDKIVFVAFPEFGTPQSITGLLYGHDQAIAGGVILHSNIAKGLGQNMPSAYTLLPSDAYFNSTQQVLIDGAAVKNKAGLNVLLTQKASINNHLLHEADELHRSLDTWVPPSNTKVFQIVGTGLLTVKGVTTDEKQKPLPLYNASGDGVVQDMYDDFLGKYARTGFTYTVDLTGTSYKHMNMMNSPKALEKIGAILNGPSQEESSVRVRGSEESYSLLRITSSSTPLTQKNVSASGTTLKHMQKGQFDMSTTALAKGRFELIDSDIIYVHAGSTEPVRIEEHVGDEFSVRSLSRSEGQAVETVYSRVHLLPDSTLVIPVATTSLQISLPLISSSIYIEPSYEVIYDSSMSVAETKQLATSTPEDLSTRIERVKKELNSSNVTSYVKTRYMKRLDAILATKKEGDLDLLQTALRQGIEGIQRFANVPILRTRYAKLKQDYTYILYLLLLKP